jgi:hypothetical protein
MHNPDDSIAEGKALSRARAQVVVEVETYGSDEGATPELDEVVIILEAAGFGSIGVDEPLKGSRVFLVCARRG